ncbi:tail fiber assembly protein [Lonsdalea quercina]
MSYRKSVPPVDITTAPDITWPDEPE